MTKPLRPPLRSAPFPLIAELGNDRCAALGIIGRGEAPVLDLCRKLIANGLDPATPLHVYRGHVLALRIRSIGEAAALMVKINDRGMPVFRRYRKAGVIAPPVAPTTSTLPSEPPGPADAPTLAGDHAAGDDDIIERIERQQHERDDDIIERIERQQHERNDPGEPPLEYDGGRGRP